MKKQFNRLQHPSPENWTGVWPLSSGISLCNGIFGDVTRDFFCLHFVASGKIKYRVRADIEVQLDYGNMFLIWPGIRSSYLDQSGPDQPGSWVLWVRLGGPLAAGYVRSLGFEEWRMHLAPRRPEGVRKIFGNINNAVRDGSADSLPRAVSALYDLLPACDYEVEKAPSKPSTLVEKVSRFIDQELPHVISVDHLCDIFNVSRGTLHIHFKRETGKSPIQAIIEARIRTAKRLLESSDLSITEIAAACGYTDVLYFIRQFKKEIGLPPGEYRTTH